MSLNFLHHTQLTDSCVDIPDISFTEYKTLCKLISFQDDSYELVKVFNTVIKHACSKELNVLDSIVALLNIRKNTLGNTIKLVYSDENITLDISLILKCFNKKFNGFEYKFNNMILTIGTPKCFLVKDQDVISFVVSGIDKISIGDKVIDLTSLTHEERLKIVEMIPGLPIKDIFNSYITHLRPYEFKIKKTDDYSASILNDTIIHLLKMLLLESLQDVLDLEYSLIRHLGLSQYDLERMPFIECRIMHNKFISESKDSSGNAQQTE